MKKSNSFYNLETIGGISLSLALMFTSILIGLNYYKCRRLSVFMLFGIALWIAVLKSGVHATLAGIVIAF